MSNSCDPRILRCEGTVDVATGDVDSCSDNDGSSDASVSNESAGLSAELSTADRNTVHGTVVARCCGVIRCDGTVKGLPGHNRQQRKRAAAVTKTLFILMATIVVMVVVALVVVIADTTHKIFFCEPRDVRCDDLEVFPQTKPGNHILLLEGTVDSYKMTSPRGNQAKWSTLSSTSLKPTHSHTFSLSLSHTHSVSLSSL